MRNIEIKARCPKPGRAREAARRLGAAFRGTLAQTDTFFNTRSGRLKLREFGDGTAELILYDRAFDTAPRPSEYVVLPVAEAARTRAMLGAAFGVWTVVRKIRELWLWENVRIHLDRVEGLGSFIELEAVVDGAHPEEACHAAVRRLMGELAIREEDLCRRSYADELAPIEDGKEGRSMVTPVPEGFHNLTPHITVKHASEAIDFYMRAFGAEELERSLSPDGKSVWHASLRVGDSILMLSDEFPDMNSLSPLSIGGTSVILTLYVPDVDAVFGRALAAGAKAVMPVADMFWGDRYGVLVDPYGHRWAIATHKEDPTPEEVRKRIEAFKG